MPMKFWAGLVLTVTNEVAPVRRLRAVTPSSGSVPALLTPGTAGTGRPLPQPSSLLAAHLPFGAMASPREKSPRLYWIPAGRTCRPSGSRVALPDMAAATAPPLGPAALAVWGAQYATATAQSDSAVAPASQRGTVPPRRRVVPNGVMANALLRNEVERDGQGETQPSPDPTVQKVNKTGHGRAECLPTV